MTARAKSPPRLLRSSAIGLLLGGGVVAVWANWKPSPPRSLPLERALWVCDWEVTRIDGPGSSAQASMVEQWKRTSLGKLSFPAPLLYRMGAGPSRSPSEGFVVMPFDPSRPESALALKGDAEASR